LNGASGASSAPVAETEFEAQSSWPDSVLSCDGRPRSPNNALRYGRIRRTHARQAGRATQSKQPLRRSKIESKVSLHSGQDPSKTSHCTPVPSRTQSPQANTRATACRPKSDDTHYRVATAWMKNLRAVHIDGRLNMKISNMAAGRLPRIII